MIPEFDRAIWALMTGSAWATAVMGGLYATAWPQWLTTAQFAVAILCGLITADKDPDIPFEVRWL